MRAAADYQQQVYLMQQQQMLLQAQQPRLPHIRLSGGSSFREEPIEAMLGGNGGLSAGATIGGVAELRRARAEEEAEDGMRLEAP